MINEVATVGNGMQTECDSSTEEKSIHAILIEKNVGMSELWLPETIEGKYTFSTAEKNISIIADGSQWKACIANGGYFALTDPVTKTASIQKSEITLNSNSLNVAHIGNKVYSLYLEEDCNADKAFQPYHLEKNMDIFIGREAACDIQYRNRFVSREHAVLHYNGDKLTIVDKNSANGVYVNGRRVQSAELQLGDVIHILGLCIVVGSGYIAMNKTNQCQIMSQRVTPLNKKKGLTYLNPTGTQIDFYDRKPRKKYKLDEKEIPIESPPAPLPKANIPLALRLSNNMFVGAAGRDTGPYRKG